MPQETRHQPLTNHSLSVVLIAIVLTLTSCNSGPRSARVDPPDFDAVTSSQQAMELYDADGDGKLSPEEQKNCPGIAANVQYYDENDDGSVSREELQARIEAWMDDGTGLMSYSVGVKLNGRPLVGAEVELQPVKFLQSLLKQGSGTTNERGQAAISISSEHLPEMHKLRQMMPPGLYQVRITHPRVKLSPSFNTETELGCEVSVEAGNPAFPIWFVVRAKK